MASVNSVGSYAQLTSFIQAGSNSKGFAGSRETNSDLASSGVFKLLGEGKKRDFEFKSYMEDSNISARNANLASNHMNAISTHLESIMEDLSALKGSIANSLSASDPAQLLRTVERAMQTVNQKSAVAKFGDKSFGVGEKNFTYNLSQDPSDSIKIKAVGTTTSDLAKVNNVFDAMETGKSIFSNKSDTGLSISTLSRSGSKSTNVIDMSDTLDNIKSQINDINGVSAHVVSAIENGRQRDLSLDYIKNSSVFTIPKSGLSFTESDKGKPIKIVYKEGFEPDAPMQKTILTYVPDGESIDQTKLDEYAASILEDDSVFYGLTSVSNSEVPEGLLLKSTTGMENILGVEIGDRMIEVSAKEPLFTPLAEQKFKYSVANDGTLGGTGHDEVMNEIKAYLVAAQGGGSGPLAADAKVPLTLHITRFDGAVSTISTEVDAERQTDDANNYDEGDLLAEIKKFKTDLIQLDKYENDTSSSQITLNNPSAPEFLGLSKIEVSLTGGQEKYAIMDYANEALVVDGGTVDKYGNNITELYEHAAIASYKSTAKTGEVQILFNEIDRSIESLSVQSVDTPDDGTTVTDTSVVDINLRYASESKNMLKDIDLTSEVGRRDAISLITTIMFALVDDLSFLSEAKSIADNRVAWEVSSTASADKGKADALRIDISKILSDMQLDNMMVSLNMGLIQDANKYTRDIFQKLIRMLS